MLPTYSAPISPPPIATCSGASPSFESPEKPPASALSPARATHETASATIEACVPPTRRPSAELSGACIATTPPIATAATSATLRSIRGRVRVHTEHEPHPRPRPARHPARRRLQFRLRRRARPPHLLRAVPAPRPRAGRRPGRPRLRAGPPPARVEPPPAALRPARGLARPEAQRPHDPLPVQGRRLLLPPGRHQERGLDLPGADRHLVVAARLRQPVPRQRRRLVRRRRAPVRQAPRPLPPRRRLRVLAPRDRHGRRRGDCALGPRQAAVRDRAAARRLRPRRRRGGL